MANERNTENLVREDLRRKGYYDSANVIIEEQQSALPRVCKLLAHASKSGNGVGRPEFIIRFKDNPDNIVVIECKASTLKHESLQRGSPADYAVDGVLLYAEYLKKDFNVTAIAVSGETEREKRVSTFLWLKGGYQYTDVQDKAFLTPEEVIQITSDQDQPISEEYLVKKAIEYNEILHRYSIPEVERCTFISSILVALQDEVFLSSYRFHSDNVELLNALFNACNRVLKRNNISIEKREVILSEYKRFQYNKLLTAQKVNIKTTGESSDNEMLKDLINDFHSNILPGVRGKHFDVLGKFYTQFIRYAGSDSKTGLVLTPPHITDFFCEVAMLQKDDVVFDPCCGTGGFLVSAMKFMLSRAGHSKSLQEKIKSQQLIGIEQRNDMFSHACSNMMMRGDGKSHIYHGNCFDEGLKRKVKSEQPNVTFLNPPYQDGNAAEQLSFIDNALECIVKGGTGIAICQMSTVVSRDKRVGEIKRKLLERHSLRAVFSMPDELFYPVGVVTCMIVFEAHCPHSPGRETFFGYFKDDGFVKQKRKGRTCDPEVWNGIKSCWLDAYINNKNIPGLSVTSEVSWYDEWCAEAYIETNYEGLSDKYFIERLKQHSIYSFVSGFNDELSKQPAALNGPPDEPNSWRRFSLKDFFNMYAGKYHPADSYGDGVVPLVTSKDENNGVRAYTDLGPNYKGPALTIGKVSCSCFFQAGDFCASSDVTVLIPKFDLDPFSGMYLSSIISLEKFKWSYGRQIRLNDSLSLKVSLPADVSGQPDWKYMSEYISSLPYSNNIK